MPRKSTITCLALVTVLALAFGAKSFQASHLALSGNVMVASPEQTPPPQPDCAQIIKDVKENVRNAIGDTNLKEFKAAGYRFGFSCKEGVVTINGKVPGEANRKKVIQAVQKTKGVKKVISKGFGTKVGCGDLYDCWGDGTKCVKDRSECHGENECCGSTGE